MRACMSAMTFRSNQMVNSVATRRAANATTTLTIAMTTSGHPRKSAIAPTLEAPCQSDARCRRQGVRPEALLIVGNEPRAGCDVRGTLLEASLGSVRSHDRLVTFGELELLGVFLVQLDEGAARNVAQRRRLADHRALVVDHSSGIEDETVRALAVGGGRAGRGRRTARRGTAVGRAGHDSRTLSRLETSQLPGQGPVLTGLEGRPRPVSLRVLTSRSGDHASRMRGILLVPALVLGSGGGTPRRQRVDVDLCVSAHVASDVVPDVDEAVPSPVVAEQPGESNADPPWLPRHSGGLQEWFELLDAALEVSERPLSLCEGGARQQDVGPGCGLGGEELDRHDMSPAPERSPGEISVGEVGNHVGAKQQEHVELAVGRSLENGPCVPSRFRRGLVPRIETRMNAHIQQSLRA